MSKYLNTGILSRNKKPRSENSPPYTGQQTVGCPNCGAHAQFWISAWANKGDNGGYFRMSLKPQEGNGGGSNSRPQQQKQQDDFDDDIPF